jgi:hypothetical protein
MLLNKAGIYSCTVPAAVDLEASGDAAAEVLPCGSYASEWNLTCASHQRMPLHATNAASRHRYLQRAESAANAAHLPTMPRTGRKPCRRCQAVEDPPGLHDRAKLCVNTFNSTNKTYSDKEALQRGESVVGGNLGRV